MTPREDALDEPDVVVEELPDEEAPAHREEDPEDLDLGAPDPETVVDDPRPRPEDDVPHDPRLSD